MTEKMKGSLALLLASVFWGSGFVAAKIGSGTMSFFSFNGMRFLAAVLILLPFAVRDIGRTGYFSQKENGYELARVRRIRTVTGSLVCGILLAGGINLQQAGLGLCSAGRSGFITILYVIIVPVMGVVVGKRPGPRLWICVTVAVAGFALLSLKGGSHGISTGDSLLLISAVVYSFQIVALNHYVTASSGVILSFGQLVVCGALSLVLGAVFDGYTLEAVRASMLPILYTAVFPTAIGFSFQTIGQEKVPPAVASLIMSLEGAFAAVFGVLILHESMTQRELLGCLLIFASVMVAQLPTKEEREQEKAV